MRTTTALLTALPLTVLLLSSPGALAARVMVAGLDVDKALRFSPGSLTDTVAGAVSRAGHDVVTTQQLEALVGLEAARQLAGCADDACVARLGADLGSALGVDAVVSVAVSRAGSGTVVAVKRINVGGGGAGGGKVADRRLKSTRIDQVLDVLPELVAEALAGLPATTTTTTATTGAATAAPATVAAPGAPAFLPAGIVVGVVPAARAKRPLALSAEQKKALRVVEDGTGRVIVYHGERPIDGPLLAGTVADGVFAQRIIGGGSEGVIDQGGSFDVTFWDARYSRGAERSFGLRDGVITLVCGSATTTWRPASKQTAARVLAKLNDVAWQRQVLLVARDDDLNWYIVDDSIADDEDLHVYVGRKVQGRYRFAPVDGEVVRDQAFGDGVLLVGAGFKIKIGATGGELIRGAEKTPLSALNAWDHAAEVYGVMKPWGDVAPGTPCD